MNKILQQLKLDLKSQDLLTDEERKKEEYILNTFENLAEQNATKSMKYIIAITADELGMKPEELVKVLDAHYYEEEDEQ